MRGILSTAKGEPLAKSQTELRLLRHRSSLADGSYRRQRLVDMPLTPDDWRDVHAFMKHVYRPFMLGIAIRALEREVRNDGVA